MELTNGGGQEERTTTESVNTARAANGNEKLEHVLAGGETGLLGLILDTRVLVDDVGVVAEQSITGILGDNAKRDENHQTVTIATGLEEVEVAAVLLCLVLHGNGLLDLAIFELHRGVVAIAVGMVLGEDVQGLFGALLGHEPTGRLGNPPEEGKLDDGGDALDKGDGPPGPVGVDIDGAEGNERDDWNPNVSFGTLCHSLSITYCRHPDSRGSYRWR